MDTLLGGLSIQVLRSLSLNKSEPLTMPLCTSISSRPQSQPVCSLLRAFVHMASLAWYTLLPWWFFLLFSARCHFLTGIFLYPPSLRSSAHTLPTHHIISLIKCCRAFPCCLVVSLGGFQDRSWIPAIAAFIVSLLFTSGLLSSTILDFPCFSVACVSSHISPGSRFSHRNII